MKTVKDYMRSNIWDGCTIEEVIGRSLDVMRTMVHSSFKESSLNDITEENLERD